MGEGQQHRGSAVQDARVSPQSRNRAKPDRRCWEEPGTRNACYLSARSPDPWSALQPAALERKRENLRQLGSKPAPVPGKQKEIEIRRRRAARSGKPTSLSCCTNSLDGTREPCAAAEDASWSLPRSQFSSKKKEEVILKRRGKSLKMNVSVKHTTTWACIANASCRLAKHPRRESTQVRSRQSPPAPS